MSEQPQLWVFAGPNGAGKSSLVQRFHVARRILVIDPYRITRTLGPDHRGEAGIMLEAGRIATQQRRALIDAAQSFAFETTLTGHSELRVMRDARALGYKVTLVFVGLEHVSVSFARVRERVAQGGHDVPLQAIVRRYAKSLANLPTAIGLADRCFLLDNSATRYRLLATIQNGEIRHRAATLPEWAITITATDDSS